MTAPVTGSQAVRLCRYDGFPLELDRALAQATIDAGWPAVELLACRNGHSVRIWPAVSPALRRVGRPCCVCGLGLPSNRRKFHLGRCMAIGYAASSRWHREHPREAFIVENQPWYRGPLYVATPLEPLDPLAGRMPAAWADGYLRAYGGLSPEVAA